MDALDKYKVNLKDLQAGVATYRFELDDAFFELVGGTLVKGGHADVMLSVEEKGGIYALIFHIRGVVCVPCDRCLDDMDVAVDTENVLNVKVGTEYSDEGDVVVVPEDDPACNVAWNIYEFIALSIPVAHVHEEGKCNAAMMEMLAAHLVTSEDMDDTGGGEKAEVTDPRWDKLKDIINN